MELYESHDIKNQLLKKSLQQREALEDEAKLISARTQKILTTALVVGGSLAVTYFVIKQLSGSKSKQKKRSGKIQFVTQPVSQEATAVGEDHTPGIVSQIGAALASQAAVFLLDLAKEKLSEYLESQAQKKANS